ncbi:flavin-containing monooxygenase FMO GS-OX5-like isoform X2 [Venturia canescens]|uniref:flavin-containing monooxygenase FMO GS-OX5-like isoform X2 n=1 Tax=Venturia canescens TaxID=32260 RepID=UPI001C9C710C|nr:flavin-containing monooxygenase FMO GS-OX5-like isoform X2 [Venturia canescens]
MRVAVIGAGAAGLAALRHSTDTTSGQDNEAIKVTEVVCFEKTDKIGGTWVYEKNTGSDAYGLPIHSSMYDSLRTNLPKEIMGYPDFPISIDEPKSYLTRIEILDFLNRYCDHFQLRQHIRFHHNVETVEPLEGSSGVTGSNLRAPKWSVKVRDLTNKEILKNEIFDAVMVCNGHYFEPSLPSIQGHDVFKGQQLHSHDYRLPDAFQGKTVAVLGAGPSGMDLALEISKKAKHVILSHHNKDPIHTVFPANVVQKPDIKELTENGVVYKDGSSESVDIIFYCTGYKYSFPFLAESCNVKVDDNMVRPLWKHLVSIENVTLALVGLPFYVCAFSMFDLQVRFLLRFWRGEKKFPSKESMLAEESAELAEKIKEGVDKRHFHMMGPNQARYYDDLANVAGIIPLPPVLTKLHNESSQRFLDDLVHYREDRYQILDDLNFIQL